MPGAEALVRRLKASGLSLGVATSSSSKHYQLKTSQHEWFQLFETVVCADHPRIARLKPAPDIFLVAAEELGAPPSQCLVVEDSLAGVTAARAAGMQVLAIVDRNQDVAPFSVAQRIVHSYAEFELAD
jgi:pseudouridine-5'-monophosphatase